MEIHSFIRSFIHSFIHSEEEEEEEEEEFLRRNLTRHSGVVQQYHDTTIRYIKQYPYANV